MTDGRALVDYAADEASTYRGDFGSSVPLKYLTERVAGYMHAYTLYSAVRPFGSTIMLGSYTESDGAQLYCVEPSGVFFGYWGCAAGKAKQAAKTEIEKITPKDMTCQELLKEAAKIIYQVHDEVKDKMFELELSWVTEATGGKHERVKGAAFDEAEKFAKAALEDDSDSDDDDMS